MICRWEANFPGEIHIFAIFDSCFHFDFWFVKSKHDIRFCTKVKRWYTAIHIMYHIQLPIHENNIDSFESKQGIQFVQFNLLENLFRIGKTSYIAFQSDPFGDIITSFRVWLCVRILFLRVRILWLRAGTLWLRTITLWLRAGTLWFGIF